MYVTLLVAGAAYVYHKGLNTLVKAVGVLLIPWIVAFGSIELFFGAALVF